MTFATQIDAARRGILTKQMAQVLAKEPISEADLIGRLADGLIVIPANRNHRNLVATGIGAGLSTKVNVNLGMSENGCNIEQALDRIRRSIELKVDSIMDLSTCGDTRSFRKSVIDLSSVIIGTVPIYDTVVRHGVKITDIKVDDFFEVIKMHAEDGIDFMTIHAGLNQLVFNCICANPRLTDLISQGGSLLLDWMKANNQENPFFEHFDRLLEICHEYDVTLSLGDGLRSSCLKDAADINQTQELIVLGELTKRAREAGVQVMIEGLGYVPIKEISTNVQLVKKLCHGAPFYVTGPMVTSIAPGYEYITSTIGGAIAATYGANFLCTSPPAENLLVSNFDDIKEGVVASRIAAHTADIANGVPGAIKCENAMNRARIARDSKRILELSIDPGKKRSDCPQCSKPTDNEGYTNVHPVDIGLQF